MTFYELASSRYSVRAYADTPIEPEKLNLILEAGRVAPTAHNNQPQRIFVVQDKALLDKLTEDCPCTFHAPAVLAVCYDTQRHSVSTMRNGHTYGEIDATIVCTHMMLQAWELGIGSCMVGLFRDEKVIAALNLPESLRVALLMPIGYPAERAKPSHLHSKIRPAEETITYL